MIFSTFSYTKMPRHCSAPGCTTRDSRQTRDDNISFHRLFVSQNRTWKPLRDVFHWKCYFLSTIGWMLGNCVSYSGLTDGGRLPRKDDPRRNLWIANCRRTDPSGNGLWEPLSDYIYFCSKHFEKSCFELSGISGYHRLKEDAVPTIFSTSTKSQRVTKLKSQKKKNPKPKVKRRLDLLTRDNPASSEVVEQPDGGCFDGRRYDSVPAADLVNFHGLCPENIDIPADAAPAEGALPTAVEHQMHPEATLEDIEVATVISGPLSDFELSHVHEAEMSSEICVNTEPVAPTEEAMQRARPVSPSVYMMRIPQPPGSYIQNEHSYHVGNALLWKKRAESALEALTKVQRQLEACRRREQRLRLRISALQQEHIRERRVQTDVREKLKEHLQVFELQLINDFV